MILYDQSAEAQVSSKQSCHRLILNVSDLPL